MINEVGKTKNVMSETAVSAESKVGGTCVTAGRLVLLRTRVVDRAGSLRD